MESKIPNSKPRSSLSRELNETALGMRGFVFGGFVAVCLCVFGALVIEQIFVEQFYDSGDVIVSYGQDAIILLPICAMIGAVTGFIIGAGFSHRWELGTVLLTLAILVNGTLLWISSESLFEFFHSQTIKQQSMNRGELVFSGALTLTLTAAAISALVSLILRFRRATRHRKPDSIAV